MTSTIAKALDALAPADGFTGTWSDVLARAREIPKATTDEAASERPSSAPTRRRWPRSRRPVAVAVVAAVAVLTPLGSLSAANGWWFFAHSEAPAPTTPTTSTPTTGQQLPPSGGAPPMPLSGGPTVIKTGSWEGKAWTLVAYISDQGGVCFAMSPTATVHDAGEGAALGCAPFQGVAQPAGAHVQALPITYLAGGASPELPAYIAGPVIKAATTVEIDLASGGVILTDTFRGPPPLDQVAFYAAELPKGALSKPGDKGPVFTKLIGRDSDNHVVACFAPPYGPMPPSACSG